VIFSYYNRVTEDALVSRRRAPSVGFEGTQLVNAGKFKNTGVELQLEGRVLERDLVAWDLGFSVYTNRSEVLDLGGAPPFAVSGRQGWIYEGQPVPVVRGWAVLNPDEFAEPIIEQNYLFGPNAPTHIFGINSQVRLPRGVSIAGRGEYQGGHFMQELNYALLALRGVSPACEGISELLGGDGRNGLTARQRELCDPRYLSIDSGIVPADFFRLREVSMGLPVQRALPGIDRARLTLTAHNFVSWIRSELLFDPEISMGGMNQMTMASLEMVPAPRTVTAALRVTF
jgi:TonB-dependent starch-binding outer membrane protein SusC